MDIQWDQRLISSFLMFLDNQVLKQGNCYTNHTGRFYPVSSNVNGSYIYAAPFKQLVSDNGVTGATVISGVYLNSNYITVGQSGLQKINYPQGALYFSGQLPTNTSITGSFSIKEFNIEYTSDPEYKLLFEDKYVINGRFTQNLSGLATDTKTAPAIFVKAKTAENLPFAFSRVDNNTVKFRLVVIGDSEFSKIGVCGILKNLNMREFRIASGIHPLTFEGSYTGVPYNYDNLTFSPTYWPIIFDSRVIDIPLRGEYANMARNVAMCDLTVETIMRHP